jgi:hypothetical protein
LLSSGSQLLLRCTISYLRPYSYAHASSRGARRWMKSDLVLKMLLVLGAHPPFPPLCGRSFVAPPLLVASAQMRVLARIIINKR